MNLNNLEEVIAASTTTSDHGKLATALRTFMKRDVAESILASTLPNDVDPFTVLNPNENTLGYLYVLAARLEGSYTPDAILPHIIAFSQNFNPIAVRHAPERLSALAIRIVKVPHESALVALRDIVLRYPVAPVYLTALHPIFLRACVATRNFELARPILDNFITEVDPRAFPVTYLDNLIYHYSGGVAFSVLRQWEEAQDFLEIVVGAPVSGNPSAIQLEAAKKLALVHLIRHGQLVNLPKYVHPMLNKLVRNSPYGALAKAYPSGAYITVMEKEEKVFRGDNNWGLVNLAVEKAPRWKLKTLNKTYQTLSLSEIAKEISMPNDASLRELVETMVKEGEIMAVLAEDNTLTFIDKTINFCPQEIEEYLREAQRQCTILAEIDKQIGRSKEFLSKAIKDRELSASASNWAGDEDSIAWDEAMYS